MAFEIPGYLNFTAIFRRRRRETRRIAFQAYTPLTAQVFRPVVQGLKSVQGVDIVFIVMFHPYYGLKGLRETRRFARRKLGIPASDIFYVWQTTWKHMDALICSDVYAKFPLRKTTKVLVPHGPGLHIRLIRKSVLRKTVSDFDFHFVCGQLDQRQIRPLIGPRTQLRITGFPFMDALARRPVADRRGFAKRFGLDPAKKIVLYAPSWGHTYHSGDILGRNFESVMRCLATTDVTVLVKLHAASYVEGQSLGMRWHQRLQDYRDKSDVIVLDELNDIPSFQIADLLITDISSRSLCFMITAKPVIVHGVPHDFVRTPIEKARMEMISKAAVVTRTAADLSQALASCLAHPEKGQSERHALVTDVFERPGCATQETVGHVIRILPPLNEKKN